MDWAQILVQLGVAGFALYILWDQGKRHDVRMDAKDVAFETFVQTNNHKVTELVVQATVAVKEGSAAIKEASESIRANTEILKEVRDDMIRIRG